MLLMLWVGWRGGPLCGYDEGLCQHGESAVVVLVCLIGIDTPVPFLICFGQWVFSRSRPATGVNLLQTVPHPSAVLYPGPRRAPAKLRMRCLTSGFVRLSVLRRLGWGG